MNRVSLCYQSWYFVGGILNAVFNRTDNALAQDEFPILSTTQTLSMIGAILLLVEIFSIFCATSRVIPEKRVRLTLLITTASGGKYKFANTVSRLATFTYQK